MTSATRFAVVALKDALETFELIHEMVNENECKWDEDTHMHCPGICTETGCLERRIDYIRSTISARQRDEGVK